MGTPKVKSATSLRSDLYETLKEVSDGEPQIITHKQGDPVLLISKDKYDELVDQGNDFRKMAIGLSQIESGEGVAHKKAAQKLRALKKKWK